MAIALFTLLLIGVFVAMLVGLALVGIGILRIVWTIVKWACCTIANAANHALKRRKTRNPQ